MLSCKTFATNSLKLNFLQDACRIPTPKLLHVGTPIDSNSSVDNGGGTRYHVNPSQIHSLENSVVTGYKSVITHVNYVKTFILNFMLNHQKINCKPRRMLSENFGLAFFVFIQNIRIFFDKNANHWKYGMVHQIVSPISNL